MKYLYLFSLTLILVSCDLDFHSDLCEAISYNDDHFVRDHIDDILDNMPPLPEFDDPLGHFYNLESLAIEISKDRCADAVIVCYACIETFPPQSELHVIIDDGRYYVEKYIIIATPPESEMYFIGMYD